MSGSGFYRKNLEPLRKPPKKVRFKNFKEKRNLKIQWFLPEAKNNPKEARKLVGKPKEIGN